LEGTQDADKEKERQRLEEPETGEIKVKQMEVDDEARRSFCRLLFSSAPPCHPPSSSLTSVTSGAPASSPTGFLRSSILSVTGSSGTVEVDGFICTSLTGPTGAVAIELTMQEEVPEPIKNVFEDPDVQPEEQTTAPVGPVNDCLLYMEGCPQ
jgi:hypothetical protein